jgi:hypothetical protein
MNEKSFSLQPFAGSGSSSRYAISGAIGRRTTALAIHYALLGPLTELAIPAPAEGGPARKDGLWKETCFDLFLAPDNLPGYWEFNLSPARHWNVYRFTDYRQGMEEETAFASLPFSVLRFSNSLSIDLEVDLERIIEPGRVLRVGVSAVIRHRSEELSYWALTHPGPRADFHRRESFIVELQGAGSRRDSERRVI